MDTLSPKIRQLKFHGLKISKKELLTKTVFMMELEIPQNLHSKFTFLAGQFITVKYAAGDEICYQDFSIASAPYEGIIRFAVKINSEKSLSNYLFNNYNEGDILEISEAQGRFTLASKPDEFRTIVAFAAGTGITPIFSHIKHLLHSEPRTRIYLFYGNRTREEVVFQNELDLLEKQHSGRFHVYYFFSQDIDATGLFRGRLDAAKLNLIINQILHTDDTDEEATLWDAVDEVLICGRGEMIKDLANASFHHGIPKKNIHFELFESFNDDIYPQEKEFPLIENISINFKINQNIYTTTLPNNRARILQQLLAQKFSVPYSCKSGICGICECKVVKGEVELLENEYLTEKEEQNGQILACMAIPMSDNIELNFDPN